MDAHAAAASHSCASAGLCSPGLAGSTLSARRDSTCSCTDVCQPRSGIMVGPMAERKSATALESPSCISNEDLSISSTQTFLFERCSIIMPREPISQVPIAPTQTARASWADIEDPEFVSGILAVTVRPNTRDKVFMSFARGALARSLLYVYA